MGDRYDWESRHPDDYQLEQRVLEAMNKHVDEIKETPFNPFWRDGLTPLDIAYVLEFTTGKYLKSGRAQADMPRTRLFIKSMVKKQLIKSIGYSRTLQCGSRSQAMYIPFDIPDDYRKTAYDNFGK